MTHYTMKDLGYKRTPTSAALRVSMPDGWWSVPVQAIVDDRDANYADEREDTVGFILSGQLNTNEITDWAANNMNWADVAEYALKLPNPSPPPDYEDGWVNGTKMIVGLGLGVRDNDRN